MTEAKPFYNTIKLSGEELKRAVINARKQEEAILLLFKNFKDKMSPSEVLKILQRANKNPPLTSVRRAMTNLTISKDLVMTNEQVKGLYDKPEHLWALNKVKHPTETNYKQQSFF